MSQRLSGLKPAETPAPASTASTALRTTSLRKGRSFLGRKFSTKVKPSIPRRISISGSNVTRQDSNAEFVHNQINTCKYTLLNFVPKSIFEQFRRLANVYFLSVSCLQLFTDLSPTSKFTTALPLFIIVCMTSAKEAIEDYKRSMADQQINTRKATVITGGSPQEVMWQNIVVGDIIKLKADDGVPADCVVISTSELNAVCYIETANLDGETNLKVRSAPEKVYKHCSTVETVGKLHIDVTAETPSADLYSFHGKLLLSGLRGPDVDVPLSRKIFFQGARSYVIPKNCMPSSYTQDPTRSWL